ncbi:permease prefix domain 1-containing protein [Clostridium sp. 'White wine YQ']|uniref:permease prefix domain 1-containing protein n=1 Tax=Clostridium sp. 'White wine YQ' TaxID=3027474 RepID=UPI0023654EC7|nr:permease prefix domain 1-containing protein [Clostridium sp. 'White wine YQ']MDD7795845.1 permease prefix domain 1-containing protein [Clostridium sp. 'White wine YQ']
MYEKLRERVEELFQDAPRTNRAYELKEEVLANLIDRYNDLIEQGKSENEAINSAMSGVGDVEELIRGLKQNDVFNYEEMRKERQKSALIISVSVGLYIMSVVVLLICNELLGINDAISVSLMLTIDAVATGLIIYNAMSKPKYIKEDNTMVEEFKEWKSTNRKKNGVMQSIKSIVWTLIVAIYLLISFVFNAWAFSWIIFIVGAAIERIITLSFQLKE